MPIPRDVEVEFEELDTAHGGRTHPLVTGSRPQFYYLGGDWDCNVEIISTGNPQSRVGVRAYLAFLSPHKHLGRLHEGSPFLLREGHRTVGFGIVTRVVDLEESARIAAANEARYTWHREAAT
jgi:translation elongation factor EF-Tu-like GTPase